MGWGGGACTLTTAASKARSSCRPVVPPPGWLAGWQGGQGNAGGAAEEQGWCWHVLQEHPSQASAAYVLRLVSELSGHRGLVEVPLLSALQQETKVYGANCCVVHARARSHVADRAGR